MRKAIDLPTKLEIIDKVEKGEKQIKVCEDYDLSKQSVPTIIANIAKYKITFEENRVLEGGKRVRTSDYTKLDEDLSNWYFQMRVKCLPINGRIAERKGDVVRNDELQ